jgi:hypothetical protein
MLLKGLKPYEAKTEQSEGKKTAPQKSDRNKQIAFRLRSLDLQLQ